MLGTSLLWRSTVAFTYLKVKSAKCLRLLPVPYGLGFGLVRSGLDLGLGLKNLVLFTSLPGAATVPRCKPVKHILQWFCVTLSTCCTCQKAFYGRYHALV